MTGTHAVERLITIDLIVHRETRLIVATSEEMRGLIVHARTDAELNKRIPEAIRALLEAEGHTVTSVKPLDADNLPPGGFVPNKRRFQAVAAH